MRRFLSLAALLCPGTVLSQLPAPAAEPIQDNSFLVEEAYNQGPGIVQHVTTFGRPRRGSGWELGFTQEWPVRSQRHQLSYTVIVARPPGAGGAAGIGDLAIHYRRQLGRITGASTAFAPRVSLLLPTGSASDGRGAGGMGVQLNLPFSMELPRAFVAHSNAGATYTPRARDASGAAATTDSYFLGQSLIWLVRQDLNLMLEATWTSTEEVAGSGRTVRSREILVAPGIRGAFDFASGLQVVPGLAVPIAVGSTGGEWSVLGYLSFEHAFARRDR